MEASLNVHDPKDWLRNGYDIHVVFQPEQEAAATQFYNAFMNFVRNHKIPHDRPIIFKRPVGPWPIPMWQVLLTEHSDLDQLHQDLGKCLGWLMLNRGQFSVMIHPNTNKDGSFGGDYRDHKDYSLWIGPPIDLILDIFSKD